MHTSVLVAHADPRVRRALRSMLEGADYVVMEATDAESALLTLRESERCMVVLFDVAVYNNTLTGADSLAILGAASHDPDLVDQHAYVVITPTPESVEVVFGNLLNHISATIVVEPVDPAVLLQACDRAAERLFVTA